MVHTPRTSPPPAELVTHGKRWTVRYESIASGSSTGDWATQSAKKVLAVALRGLAHGKCVYCESALGVTTYLEIEHYVAKTVTPALAFEWTNLLPACRLCNNPKSEQDHKGALLKPDAVDPEPYFWIHPDTGKLEPHPKLDAVQSRRANETIRICDLQRPALCTKRVEMLMRSAPSDRFAVGGAMRSSHGVQVRAAPRPRNPWSTPDSRNRPGAVHTRARMNEC